MKKNWRTNGDHASESINNALIDKSELIDYISEMPSYELKDFLCDIVGVNHHTSKEDLLTAIGEKL